MEWLRSCYQSAWRLFADDFSRLTPGRYYFSEPGTPFYAGQHRLGSKVWWDKNWQVAEGLGEDASTPQEWDDGGPPAVNPLAQAVGNAGCIADGDTTEDIVPYDDLVNGFVPGCFVPNVPPATPCQRGADITSCSVQLAYAKIIEWSYDENWLAIRDFLGGFLGPTFTLYFSPPTDLLPAYNVAVSPSCTFVWIDGTANFQQFALQVAYALKPPQDFGGFSTSAFWYQASEVVIRALPELGANPTGPVLFCGHSYGGAAALICAARYRLAQPDRQIRYLTYGAPRIGDNRIVALLRSCEGLCLCNDIDIVAAIPPGFDVLAPVYTVLLNALLLTWPLWKAAPYQAMMDLGGNVLLGGVPILDYPTLFAFATDVLASTPFPTIPSHAITGYFARILARCGEAEWPLTLTDFEKLFATGFILLEDEGYVLLEDGGRIQLED